MSSQQKLRSLLAVYSVICYEDLKVPAASAYAKQRPICANDIDMSLDLFDNSLIT